MRKQKLLIFFENRIASGEPFIIRGCLGLKLLCFEGIHLTTVSSIEDYVRVLCSPYDMHILTSVVDPSVTKDINFSSYTAVFASEKDPNIPVAKSLNADIFIIPSFKKIRIGPPSLVFGDYFNYPDLRKLRDLITPEISKFVRQGSIL